MFIKWDARKRLGVGWEQIFFVILSAPVFFCWNKSILLLRTCQRIRITPSTTKPGMEGPSTIQTGQITPWLVLLVIFADMEGGPHLSSSPLSLHPSSPASIPAAPPHFSPACSPSRWTAGAARHAGGRWPGQRGCGLPWEPRPTAVPPHLLHSRRHHLHCRRRPSSIHPLR